MKVYSRATTKSIPLLQPEHGFFKRMDQNISKQGIGIQLKKWWWYLFISMVDIVLQVVWVLSCIKIKAIKPLPLLAFRRDVVNAIFPEYSKKDKSSPSHTGIRNTPSDAFYDGTKHC